MQKYLFPLILAFAFAACNTDLSISEDNTSRLVVEGWIEDGGFPVVMLTRSLPVSANYQSMDDLDGFILRWAKVTVSNGEDTVILTGKYDRGYFSPFIYTTSRMRGEAGKKYTLTVEYRDYYATSVTSIPAPPDLCTFSVEPCIDSDTLYQIKATFKDNPSGKNYYQFFTRIGTSTKQYQASYLGTIDDEVLNTITEMPVYRGHQLNVDKYTPYFTLHDTVSVKFAHIDEASFRVWDSYTKTLSLSTNMFLSTSTDMETNINGGYGYWCGYGAITDHIVIQDSISQ